MGKILNTIKYGLSSLFENKKNLINFLMLAILIAAIPLGLDLVRRQQIMKSRANINPIVFTGPGVSLLEGNWVTTQPQVSLELTSPLGPRGVYDCAARYRLTPESPQTNADLEIRITSANSPNYNCPVLYLDNRAVPVESCNISPANGSGRCSIKSGTAGAHILQLKFGQAAVYPDTDCQTTITCNTAVYQNNQQN